MRAMGIDVEDLGGAGVGEAGPAPVTAIDRDEAQHLERPAEDRDPEEAALGQESRQPRLWRLAL